MFVNTRFKPIFYHSPKILHSDTILPNTHRISVSDSLVLSSKNSLFSPFTLSLLYTCRKKIRAFSTNPENRLLAVLTESGRFFLLDCRTKTRLRKHKFPTVHSLVWVSSDALLLFGDYLQLFRVATDTCESVSVFSNFLLTETNKLFAVKDKVFLETDKLVIETRFTGKSLERLQTYIQKRLHFARTASCSFVCVGELLHVLANSSGEETVRFELAVPLLELAVTELTLSFFLLVCLTSHTAELFVTDLVSLTPVWSFVFPATELLSVGSSVPMTTKLLSTSKVEVSVFLPNSVVVCTVTGLHLEKKTDSVNEPKTAMQEMFVVKKAKLDFGREKYEKEARLEWLLKLGRTKEAVSKLTRAVLNKKEKREKLLALLEELEIADSLLVLLESLDEKMLVKLRIAIESYSEQCYEKIKKHVLSTIREFSSSNLPVQHFEE